MSEKEIEMKLEEYKGLIISTAKRYHLEGMTVEDNFQELCLVFVNALKDFEAHRGVELKTLFIRYAKRWAWYYLRKQGYQKRGRLINYGLDKDGDRLWIDSIEDTSLRPDEINDKMMMFEDIQKFIKLNKNGYLIERIDGMGETATKIAQEEGVTYQAISQRHNIVKKQLREYLKNMGYILD